MIESSTGLDDERLFGESLLYFYRNRRRFQDWHAVVIYPDRSIEQSDCFPYRSLLNSEQMHRVYLNELGEPDELPCGSGKAGDRTSRTGGNAGRAQTSDN